MYLSFLNQVSNFQLLLLTKLHFQRAKVLLKVLDLFRSWDRDNVLSLSQQPSESQLSGGTSLLLSNGDESIYKLEILGKILGCESRHAPSEVAFFKIIRGAVFTREEASKTR